MERRGILAIYNEWKARRSSESAIRSNVERVRQKVEQALQGHFGKVILDPWVVSFAGELSTLPENVDRSINRASFLLRCGFIVPELARSLKSSDQESQISIRSYDSEHAHHIYLTISQPTHEIVVDPTIGQYIEGYNHVFVGTRNQLRSLMLGANMLQAGIGESREQFFQRIWGDSSVPAVSSEKWARVIEGNMDS